MNLSELRQEAWDIAREETTVVDSDRFWTETEMNRYINRVYRHIASETRCIRDATTVGVCLLTSTPIDYTTYTPGTLDYLWANDTSSWLYQQNVCPYLFDLHTSIIQIDEVKWVSRQWKLTKVSVNKWATNPWWERVVGMPTEYATDYQVKKIALNFRDTTSDTLQLSVRRMPLTLLVEDTDEPEFRENYHQFMINGILYQMYSKQDAETVDPAKAAEYRQLYKEDVDEIKQLETVLEYRLSPNNSLGAFR